jgi:glycosyltransferase involved in cell wall biosynthesis
VGEKDLPQIGFVRSGHVLPWDISLVREIRALGYDVSFISPLKETLSIPHRRAMGWRSFSAIDKMLRTGFVWYLNRLIKYNISDTFSKFFLPKKAFKDFEYLIFNDDIFSLPYQSIKSKINYGIVSWENIPFHYYYEYERHLRKERQIVFENAKHLFPVSEDAKMRLIEEKVSLEKIHKIHPGIDTSLFSPGTPTNTFGLPEDLIHNNTLIGSSRIVYSKGITYVLRAIHVLKKRNVKVNYIVAGGMSSEFGDYCKRLANKLEISDRVFFLGRLKYDLLVDLYRLGDIFLFPSLPSFYWEEQMGYALLEATSCGLPAIRSDSTSLDEVCPENLCKTVPAGHTEKMANAIQLLIEDSQLRSKLGKESREYVKSNYNVLDQAKEYIHYYKESRDAYPGR